MLLFLLEPSQKSDTCHAYCTTMVYPPPAAADVAEHTPLMLMSWRRYGSISAAATLTTDNSQGSVRNACNHTEHIKQNTFTYKAHPHSTQVHTTHTTQTHTPAHMYCTHAHYTHTHTRTHALHTYIHHYTHTCATHIHTHAHTRALHTRTHSIDHAFTPNLYITSLTKPQNIHSLSPLHTHTHTLLKDTLIEYES